MRRNNGSIFPSLLLVAFIVLKLLNKIDWSWWWVLSPFWIPLTLVVVGFIPFFIYKMLIEKRGEKHE